MNNALPKSIQLEAHHQLIWMRLALLLQERCFPGAFLLAGARHMGLLTVADRFMACVLCERQSDAPCGVCQSCHLLMHSLHPDIQYLGQDALKIDHVRELQRDIYQTPQRGAHRFVVIYADGLHVSAANALLKILEEPPAHTMFILITEDRHALPVTIVSRCQQYVFHQHTTDFDYLSLGQHYPQEASRHKLYQEQTLFISRLCDMLSLKISPCTFVSEWARYEFGDMLWFLYLITAHAIQLTLMPQANHALTPFAQLMTPVRLFTQLRALNGLIRKNNQNIAINATLALETLLFGYLEEKEK